jgi:hypothetical protein
MTCLQTVTQSIIYKSAFRIEHGTAMEHKKIHRCGQPGLAIGLRRLLIGGCIALVTVACAQTDNTPPPQIVSGLTGSWQQVNGTGNMRFYPDATVKMMFPDHRPPIQLLTSYEMLKGKIGINAGGYWSGPIMLDLSLAKRRIILNLPNEKPITLEKRP